MSRRPTYLRTVVTTACPLACSYCHMEGDPQRPGLPRGLPADELRALLRIAARLGFRKFKFLGGEPLVRADLPDVVADLRANCPDADLSVVTSGVARVDRVERLFAAGLDRVNVSVHGWTVAAFGERRGGLAAHAMRRDLLDLLVASGRSVKLNYVYTSPGDEADLSALLDWAAPRPVVVGLLDDLGNGALGTDALAHALARLRGPWACAAEDEDPHSLPTTLLRFPDGLRVELKTSHLGETAPWAACGACPARPQCREGIHALRLTHDGRFRPCMDRPDLAFAAADALRELGERDAGRAVERWLREACP